MSQEPGNCAQSRPQAQTRSAKVQAFASFPRRSRGRRTLQTTDAGWERREGPRPRRAGSERVRGQRARRACAGRADVPVRSVLGNVERPTDPVGARPGRARAVRPDSLCLRAAMPAARGAGAAPVGLRGGASLWACPRLRGGASLWACPVPGPSFVVGVSGAGPRCGRVCALLWACPRCSGAGLHCGRVRWVRGGASL